MRCEFIEAHRREFEAWIMCRVLQVSPSGYYAWRSRGESERARSNRCLLVEIRAVHAESKRRYGSPKVHGELRARGFDCNEKRVARLMREDGLRAKRSRKFKATTDSRHDFPVAPNLLNREFEVSRPDEVWVSDITYVWTREGWLYLAIVLDLFSRRVVGWSMSHRMTRSLALDALSAAIGNRSPGPGLLHHSDRGSQYASTDYRKLLERHGMKCSMSRKGDCWDNAVAESFFSSYKVESVFGEDFQTREEARGKTFEYIEAFYNQTRLHSTLGYLSPVEFEQEQAA